MDDPVDELTEITLARFAVAINVIREAAVEAGLPEDHVAAVIARARAAFITDLAGTVTALRAACDDPNAARH
jgi:hypothetical protein